MSDKLSDNPYDSQVQLAGGAAPSSGLLMVYANNKWGTVCHKGFTSATADSACRQLGYTNALGYSGASRYECCTFGQISYHAWCIYEVFVVVVSTTQNNVLRQYLKQAQHDDYSDFALSCQGSTCSSG